jgi:hypothetical protein
MADASEVHINWHCAQLASAEHCTLSTDRDGYRFVGVVVSPLDDVPSHIEYSLVVDRRWRTRRAHATIATSLGRREIEILARTNGGWDVDGVPMSDLVDCDDVDLGWTPSTNTIPIRRLALEVGESRTITAAWIRYPELDVVPNVQRYSRLATNHWLYQAGAYEFELVVDVATGLVLEYGDDLWRTSAFSGA